MSPYMTVCYVPLAWIALGGTSAFIHLFASAAFREKLWTMHGWARIIGVLRVVSMGAMAGPFAFAYMLTVFVTQVRNGRGAP